MPGNLRLAKGLVKPLDKQLTTSRWMGCIVAVYDYTVREKAVVRVERSRARRGTKRRGRRSGCKLGRKRRHVVVADPGVHISPPSKGREARGAYLKERYRKLVEKRVHTLCRYESWLEQVGKPGPPMAAKFRLLCKDLRRSILIDWRRLKGDSELFCRNALRVYMQVLRFGWDSLPDPHECERLITSRMAIADTTTRPPYTVVRSYNRRRVTKVHHLCNDPLCERDGSHEVGTCDQLLVLPERNRKVRVAKKVRLRRCGCKVGSKCPH